MRSRVVAVPLVMAVILADDGRPAQPYGVHMDVALAVAAALALPGVSEADHHGRRSFRVSAGKVLATVWADDQLNVMVGEDLAHAVSAQPGVELLWWGQRLSGVRVTLSDVDPALLEELLQDAWARRAPAALRRPTS